MKSEPIVLAGQNLRRTLNHEWLLTDGLGGFSMGTVCGIPQRRYHALYTAATKPPVGRIATVHSVIDWLLIHQPGIPDRRYDLASLEFHDGTIAPNGICNLIEFHYEPSTDDAPNGRCTWVYELIDPVGTLRIARSLSLTRESAVANGGSLTTVRACLDYRLDAPTTNGATFSLVARPLFAMRDFHSMRHEEVWDCTAEVQGASAIIRTGDLACHLAAPGGTIHQDHQTWRNILFSRDRARGQDCTENHQSPIAITLGLAPIATTTATAASIAHLEFSTAHRSNHASPRQPFPRITAPLLAPNSPCADLAAALGHAAEKFIVDRETKHGWATSIIAGYPWFSDWGRDTMISLPGLLLSTGQHARAADTLKGFASLLNDGLIPNCFDNGSGHAEYNTVDASLWFIQAACNLHDATGSLDATLQTACHSIIKAYQAGTAFNIHMDPSDGLIIAGDIQTQLTWMDARRDGVVFTPRHGKPVEINALWHSGLVRFAAILQASDPAEAQALRTLAEKVADSFRIDFWNAGNRCLFDCLSPDGEGDDQTWIPDAAVRPNQLFAVSLPHSPLTPEQQRAVVACVKQHLLTPAGLRTLAPSSPAYRPRFEGDLFSRDGAYHNGTVWPWLIGPYVEALLRANAFSVEARTEALAALQPLLDEFSGSGPTSQSIASIAEVYDAEGTSERPRSAEGCPMQAWSVAEVLRALTLIHMPAKP